MASSKFADTGKFSGKDLIWILPTSPVISKAVGVAKICIYVQAASFKAESSRLAVI